MCGLQGCMGYMARRMVVARTTAAEIAARWCARKVRGEDHVRPYRVGSSGSGRSRLTSGEHGAGSHPIGVYRTGNYESLQRLRLPQVSFSGNF